MERLDLRHVLCPLDFSGISKGALLYASAIARARHAELRVLHVAEKKELAGGADGLSSVRRQRLMLKLRVWLDETSPDQLVGSAVRHGDPATEILKFARSLPADMIVVAAAGADRRDRPMGHVASAVAARSECPVLVVPARRTTETSRQTGLFKRIVCAVDMTPSSTGVIRQAVAFAWETDGIVTFLCVVPEHAAPSASKVRERLLASIARLECDECQIKGLVTTGDAGPEIVRVADKLHADVVLIGPPRRWTSTTHAVLSRSSCPVMVTHDLRPIDRSAPGTHRTVFSRR
jgi:universal stress protein A